MPYADVQDIEDRIGRDLRTTPINERDQVQAWLEDIEAEIRSRIRNIDKLAEDDNYRKLLVKVETAAVLRVARNPEGKLTERIDDYSWTRDSSTASGRLFLLDEEWDLLTPTQATNAFTIRPSYTPGWRTTLDAEW